MPRCSLSGILVLLVLVTPHLLFGEETSAWREQITRRVHGRRCKAVAFSPDGRWLATAGGGGSGDVRLWDVRTGDEVAAWEAHEDETRALAFSPDGRTLATGGGIWNGPGGVALWDVATRQQITAFPVPDAGVLAVAWSPDGQTLAAGSGCVIGNQRPGGVVLWNVDQKKLAGTTLSGHSGSVPGLAFAPDGRRLVTSTLLTEPATGRVLWDLTAWDPATGQELAVIETSRQQAPDAEFFHVRQVVFSRDGSQLAGGGRTADDGLVKIWDVATGGGHRLADHQDTVWAVAFTPDGKTLATSDGPAGLIRFWNVEQARETGTLEAFRGGAFALAYSSDGRHLVAAGTSQSPDGQTREGIVKLWVRD